MGLFFTDAPRATATGGVPTARRAVRILPTDERHLSCASCPLDREPLTHPKMQPTGAQHPVLYFLGEAPGKTEDEDGVQFVGKSGSLLRDKIPIKWLNCIRWNNTIRCRPLKNRDPAPLEIACCRRLQVEDIARSKPQAIAAFGGFPLEWALGADRQISNWRGRRIPVKISTHCCWLYPIMHPAALLYSQNDQKKGAAYLRAFERDLERLFADAERGFPPPHVVTEDEARAGVVAFEQYGADGLRTVEGALAEFADTEHAVDIETDRLRPYHQEAKILSMAVGTAEAVLAFGFEHRDTRWSPPERRRLGEAIEAYLLGAGRKWVHSAKFEQEWFHARYGPRVLYDTPWGDTLGQAHILDERKGKSLDELTQLHFGFRVKALSNIDVRRLAETPLRDVLSYNGMDAKWCAALAPIQAALLASAGLTQVYEARHADTPALVQMQAAGVVPHQKHIAALSSALRAEETRLRKLIDQHPDVERFKLQNGGFNATSNPTLVRFFRDFLHIPKPTKHRDDGAWHKHGREIERGTYSVDEGALSSIRHPVASHILALRTATKNRSTYITPLHDGGKHVHGDGLVHPAFSNYITVSGRLNSEDPNAQNFPRREHKEIRRVIGCPPGHKFVAFDYGQLEARVVAAISGDQNMCAEIRAGQDIHGDWTDRIGGHFTKEKVKENRKKVRDSIKQFWTFALLYGNPLEAVAHDLEREFGVRVSPQALSPFYTDFWQRYAGVYSWQEQLVASYWRDGYVSTATGQRRHEPMSRNEIINYPIQGTAGHLVIDAQRRMSLLALHQDRPQLQPRLNIHDDLSFYFPEGTLEQDIETTARTMVQCPYPFITVPLTVEVSVGNNWADKEEIGTFSTTDFQC